jgi:hypothetical protein
LNLKKTRTPGRWKLFPPRGGIDDFLSVLLDRKDEGAFMALMEEDAKTMQDLLLSPAGVDDF